MDHQHYQELLCNLEKLEHNHGLRGRSVFLFGHCNASEELVRLLEEKGYTVAAILDNNPAKQGTACLGVPIEPPERVIAMNTEPSAVCIAARAYASMARQLNRLGYQGRIYKLVDYNSYSEYSLSDETLRERSSLLSRGIQLLEHEKEQFPGCFRFYCPFAALGDVYYAMAYLPYFLEKRQIRRYAVWTASKACADVVRLFGTQNTDVLTQQDMDASVQAALYTGDPNAYILHHDRPYAVNLAKALHVKRLTLEELYRYGVFGLQDSCTPYRPTVRNEYRELHTIEAGRAVVLSPYAKSAAHLPASCWEQVIDCCRKKGYQLFTNAVGAEKTLPGTVRLEAQLSEMHSAVERAGTFIGIRSGLCDVIQDASCRKVALYPDCRYSSTPWTQAEVYHLDNWENLVLPSSGA